jgi:hypothetical protein
MGNRSSGIPEGIVRADRADRSVLTGSSHMMQNGLRLAATLVLADVV